MRRDLIAVATVATVAAMAAVPASTAASAAVSATVRNNPTVTAISCAPGGTCVAGGRYLDASDVNHAFVLTRVNGQWGTAMDVPGLVARHSKNASITSVSCAAGGCVAGGYYEGPASRYHAFAISEKNGLWSGFTTILSGPKPSSGVFAIRSLSCSGPATCTAGGQPAFVVSEVRGHWTQARTFPAKDERGHVKVSCASAGNCTAGWGTFADTERNGRWLKAAAVPGLAAPSARVATEFGINSISCPSAGDCVIGGILPSGRRPAFVASERDGRWGRAMAIPGYGALNKTSQGLFAGVSCVSVGNCVAGGSYTADADFAGGVYEPFVVSEQNGHWGNAIELPGLPDPSTGFCEPDGDSCVEGQLFAVSCAPGGTCVAGGWYDTSAFTGMAAFVAIYQNGAWADLTQIPGLGRPATEIESQVNAVSCRPAGGCVAGGRTIQNAAFVTDEENGAWGQEHTVTFGG